MYANFNEEFPLFNWYVVETDTTRYKNTGIHTVYDSGGPADGTTSCGQRVPATRCAEPRPRTTSWRTRMNRSLPATCRIQDRSIAARRIAPAIRSRMGRLPVRQALPPAASIRLGSNQRAGRATPARKLHRIRQGTLRGWRERRHQGHVVYASTRPFDDPQMLVQTQWEPLVPHVTLNLYQRDGGRWRNSYSHLVDTTRPVAGTIGTGLPRQWHPQHELPGQSTSDLFYFSLYNQPEYLNLYNSEHGGPAVTSLPYNSQFKCYDGMHNWNNCSR